MKALVIYDSVFGNTEQIARVIAASLATKSSVEIHRAGEETQQQLAGYDLLVVGSPTRGFRPTEAVTALLKRLRPKELQGVQVAAFDTRFNADEIDSSGLRFIVKTGGYAAKRIADRLKKAGGSLAAPPEGFYVKDTEGPLKDGEIERAARWAAGLFTPGVG
jgi:flavodoxin